jgi:hypothetical protein
VSFVGLYFKAEIRVELNLFFCLYLRLYEKFLVLYPKATVRHSVIQQRQKSFVNDHLQDLSGGVILRSIVKTVKELAEWNDLLKNKFNLHFICSFSSYCSVNNLPIGYETTRLMLHSGMVDLCCKKLFIFLHGFTAIVSLSLFISEVSRLHSDAPHVVVLFWVSDRLIAKTST